MRIRAFSLAIAGLAAVLAPLGSNPVFGQPGIPHPSCSTIPATILVVGIDAAGTPDPAGEFSVEVRDFYNRPLGGITVTVDFSQCGEVRLCSDPHDAAAIVHCPTQTVRKETNTAGRATFRVVGGSNAAPGAPGALGPCAHFYFEGVHGGVARVAIYDLVGNNGLGSSDLSAWLSDFFGPLSPPRSDFDGSGSLGAADLSLWIKTFFDGGSQFGCPTAHCP